MAERSVTKQIIVVVSDDAGEIYQETFDITRLAQAARTAIKNNGGKPSAMMLRDLACIGDETGSRIGEQVVAAMQRKLNSDK